MYGFYYYDSTYMLVILGLVLCLLAQAKVKSTFKRYSRVQSHAGITGREAAEMILRRAGIYDVQVIHVAGDLTDHYDPRNRTLSLSDAVYNRTSVAALGVAAHECGHAIQHQEEYLPLALRSAFVPVANFGSTIAWPLIILGFIFNSRMSLLLLEAGVIAFALSVAFQFITLPVEFNASRRATKILGESGLLYPEEVHQVKKVLSAAALTYVASAAAAVLQLLRLVLLTNNRRR